MRKQPKAMGVGGTHPIAKRKPNAKAPYTAILAAKTCCALALALG